MNESEIKNRFDNPIGSQTIKETIDFIDKHMIVAPKVLLLIDNNTRTTPFKQLFPYICNQLSIGTGSEKMMNCTLDIMFAYGTHKEMNFKEVEKKLGTKAKGGHWHYSDIVNRYIPVYHHDWRTGNDFIGWTKSGIPIILNEKVLSYDLVISIGSIIPHATTGFSGGPKNIVPGICGGKTISEIHWKALKYSMEEILGEFHNDVRRESVEICRKLYPYFRQIIVNAIPKMGSDNMVDLVVGDVEEAHKVGCEISKKLNKVLFENKTEYTVAYADKDNNLRQAIKAICTADIITNPGGVIFLVADCPEGISPQFSDFEKIGFNHYKELETLIETGAFEDKKLLAYTLISIGRILNTKSVILVSKNITDDQARKLGFTACDPELPFLFGPGNIATPFNIINNACSVLPIIKKETKNEI